MQAVMGSQQRLWSIYGPPWGWPPETLTVAQDRDDLARQEVEMARHQSFNYALFDLGETELLGCVYLDPPVRVGAGAEISWWVVDWLVDGPIERALDRFVPQWVAANWPISSPRYVGHDLTWTEWMQLPRIEQMARLKVRSGDADPATESRQ